VSSTAETEKGKAAGDPIREMPTADPEHLTDLLWTMHSAKGQRGAIYPYVVSRVIDPFHEGLVAVFPLESEGIDSARPVLAACHALRARTVPAAWPAAVAMFAPCLLGVFSARVSRSSGP
jgi:hypothetical protein